MNDGKWLETPGLDAYSSSLELHTPLLSIGGVNNSNNNLDNALYLPNVFLQGAQLIFPSSPEGREGPR
jgi:hypothetical protein